MIADRAEIAGGGELGGVVERDDEGIDVVGFTIFC